MPEIHRKGIRARATPLSDSRSYSAAQVAEALGSRFSGESSGDEQKLWCPVCEDPHTSKSPSASVNLAELWWYCHTRGDDPDHRISLDGIVRQFTSLDAVPQGTRGAPVTRTVRELRPIEDQGVPGEWHEQLVQALSNFLPYLHTQRGLTSETIARYKIGHDGRDYTLPVHVPGLGYVNVRRYTPNPKPGFRKIWSTKGHGQAALAYTENLIGNALPVLLFEGEWDCLLAHQERRNADGVELYVGIATTGGAGQRPVNLEAVAGRQVHIAFDNDDAGRKGAERMATAMREIGAEVYVLDVRDLGVPDDAEGEDVTDAFMRYGCTAERVAAAMASARERAQSATDPVLAAVQGYFDNHAGDARLSLIDDALDDDQVMALPPAGYVIDGWVPEGFFTNLFGAPGARKTFVILDMLRHIALGEPWHGHPVRQGAAVLFEGEGLTQLGGRISAWNVVHDPPNKLPIKYLSTPVNVTTPEGVARVVRTVLDMQKRLGEPVVAVAFDPLVEYMSGDENADGTELATRGLRALARVLDDLSGSPVAVLVGAHTNAAGERARGTDHPRMRSGAHIRVETLAGDRVGLVQEKQKNGPLLAVQLTPQVVELPGDKSSLVLALHRQMSASEYAAEKATGERQHREQSRRLVLSKELAEARSAIVPALLAAVAAEPGIALGKLKARASGNGKSSDYVGDVIDELVESGQIRREIEGGGRGTHRHFPVSGATDA